MIGVTDTKLSIEEKIHTLANHYSKKSQYEKTQEEIEELLAELRGASNPFGFEDCVYFADNTWSEIADVIIMCAQLVMQHGKEDAVREQMEYKLDRQLKRINDDDTCNKHREDWRRKMMEKFDRRD